uniref:Small ribosomal subunit protein uS2c n=1 Tax=Oogamochlamys gigantea TaxID=158507 RepID=A0A0S2LN09_9CHLO|nr:ribosomal protein S2 [Oogamochlamys gigantea]ALO62817.1 ribosomal protein S2 [Oogamochlamys gigantea]
MIKNKKSKIVGMKKLERKAIRILNWSGKSRVRSRPELSQNNISTGLNSLKIGKVYLLKITALGPNNIGIDEFSYGYSIFIPNTQIGDVIKAKIVKIYNKKYKYAIAQVIKKIKTKLDEHLTVMNYKVGDVLDVNILKNGPKGTGIAELSTNLNNKAIHLIVPHAFQGQTLKVQITRIKKKFAFAKILKSQGDAQILNPIKKTKQISELILNTTSLENRQTIKIKEGSKFVMQIKLPSVVKRFVKYLVLKINGLILLVKPNLGAKPGDLVKIKCFKIISLKNKISLAFGEIIQIQPMSRKARHALIRGDLRLMLQSGIHFGEKTVKCHARMKKYIWFRKKGPNKNKPLVQKGRYLINLLKTRRCLNKALTQLSKYALKGRTFLFVGTKKSAIRLIARVSLFSKTSFFVNTRWLGGLLTNWKSILKSIKKIRPILKQKQTILKRILEKRHNIKNRLMQKAIIFRKKSKVLIKKAHTLRTKFQQLVPDLFSKVDKDKQNQDKNKKLFHEKINKKALILDFKRKQLCTKGRALLETRKKLIQKNYAILKQSLILKEKAVLIEKQYKFLLNELAVNRKKLREFGTLLVISKKISQIRQLAKQENNRLGAVSYSKLLSLRDFNKYIDVVSQTSESNTFSKNSNWVIPNPPKDIINKIILFFKPYFFKGQKNVINLTTSVYKSQPKMGSSTGITDNKLQKVLILSKLLNLFSISLPLIEKSIQNQCLKNQHLEQKIFSLKQALNLTKTKINDNIILKNKVTIELNKIKTIITQERPLVRLVRRKVKKIIAQRKLIRFLPKLRHLPTPKVKILETVKFLMTTIVDPKLKSPIEIIYDEKVKNMSKKIAAARKKRWQRLEKYFGGVAKMTKMKKNQISKNVAIIIGQKEEMNAIRECQKLGIKMLHVLDTNCNPTLADHFIPANDDSRNALEYLLKSFLVHIRLAQKLRLRLRKQNKLKKKSKVSRTHTKKKFKN